jgi:hypothetical protein
MAEIAQKPSPKPRRLALAGPAAVAAVALAAWLISLTGAPGPLEEKRAFAACIATGLAAFGVFAGLIKRSTRQVLLGLYSGVASGAVFLAVYCPLYAALMKATEKSNYEMEALIVGVAGLAALVAAWTAFGAACGWAEGGAALIGAGLRSGFRAGMWLIPVFFIAAMLGGFLLFPVVRLFAGGRSRAAAEIILWVFMLAPPAYIVAYLFFREFQRRVARPAQPAS